MVCRIHACSLRSSLTTPGTHDWSPLLYMHHSFTFTELTAFYCISDICMLASRRGGMNLVATEYVACQERRHGVLVLSECSGATSFLNAGSVTFGPANMKEISDALYSAVTMDEDEKEERYRYLRSYVSKHTRSVEVFWCHTQHCQVC